MAPSALSWQVERVVTDQTINTPAGDTVVGNYVYYVTGNGNHGVVFVQSGKFTSKHVADAIRADAKVLDDISSLSEGM